MKDSDGDGKTNGEELGDPDCVWEVGDVLIPSELLSHPGENLVIILYKLHQE